MERQVVKIQFPAFLPKQEAVRRKILYDEKIKVAGFIGGRYSGKTWAGAHIAVEYALIYPKSLILVIAPTMQQTEVARSKIDEVLSYIQTEYFPHSKIYRSYRRVPREYHLFNGSKFVFFTGANPQHLRGFHPQMSWLDEASYLSEHTFETIYLGTVLAGGKILFTTTPRGKNHWLYRVLKENPETTYYVNVSSWENPFAPKEAVEEAEKISRATGNYIQEIEGRFTEIASTLPEFDDDNIVDINKEEVLEYEERFSNFVIGIDWGWTAPTAMLVVCKEKIKTKDGEDKERIVVLEEIYQSQMLLDEIAKWLEEKIDEYPIESIIADSSGSIYINELQYKYGIPIIASKRSEKEESLVKLRTLIGHKTLVINRSCVNLISELEGFEIDPQTSRLKDEREYHCVDALRYALQAYSAEELTLLGSSKSLRKAYSIGSYMVSLGGSSEEYARNEVEKLFEEEEE